MRSLTSLAIIIVIAYGISAQDNRKGSDWESTPIDQWSSDQVSNILERSAWGKLIHGDDPVTMSVGSDPGGMRLNTVSTQNDTLILLRSSMLIRYALFRQRQLKEKYESMKDDSKESFNTKNRPLIECPACEKYYIVSISGPHPILLDKKLIMSTPKLVYLSNDKGETRELANFTPPSAVGGEAFFFFPRNDAKGQPLIRPDNTKLIFNFKIIANRTNDEGFRSYELKTPLFQTIEFNVRDLVRSGKVVF